MDQRSKWIPFNEGSTIGTKGSEGGHILKDEEHTNRARITLEQSNGNDSWTYAITCGVYSWMMHTIFGKNLQTAETRYDQMKKELQEVLRQFPMESDPETIRKTQRIYCLLEEFIAKFQDF